MFQIQFPKAEEIMVASTGNKVEGYSLEDVLLRFEVISCMSLKSEEDSGMGVNLARNASNIYESGKEIFFKQVMLEQEEIWPKDSLVRNVQINTPIKMLNAIVLLFKNVDETDSENFVSANIQSVEVDLEARTMLRNNGLREEDLYEEARRLFGANGCSDGMTKLKFERNAFALVLDFRTVNQDNVVASGIKLAGTQNGLKIRVKKKATSKDLKVYVYALPDASFLIQNGVAKDLEN